MPLYKPAQLPPQLATIYNGLSALERGPAVLFGGCLYDAEHNHKVKDYDLLLASQPGISPSEMAMRFAAAVDGMAAQQGQLGTRFYIHANDGTLIDLNITHKPLHANAEYRAGMASVGLAGIAMDMQTGLVYATNTYQRDKAERTLSLLDSAQMDYALKLQRKYPTHAIVDGQSAQRPVLRPALIS